MSQLRWWVVSQLLLLIVVCSLDHSEGARVCPKIVPGLDKLRVGVDITKLDLLPLYDLGDNGFRSAVADYTCDRGQTTVVDGESFDVPDQVDSVVIESSGQQTSSVTTIKSESQISQALSISAGISVDTAKAGFSSSASYAEMQEAITKYGRTVSQMSAVYTTCSANLSPNLLLGQNPLQTLSRLPSDFTADTEGYYDFIKTYGTHYFNKGKLGGMFLFTSETDMSYFQNKNSQQIEANVKATFASILSTETGGSSDESKEVIEFKESSLITSKFFGGQTNLAADGLTKWQPTIAKLPYFMSGTLNTISSLIADTTKRASMELAVKNYLLKAKVANLDRLTYIRLNSWTVGHNELRDLSAQLQNLKKKTIFSDEDEKLLQSIEDQVSVPAWFSDRTTFCFRSTAVGSADQCNGQSTSTLCAEPNRYTQQYMDKTYLGDTGCRLVWKLSTTESSDWFKSVKVNFRWYPTWSPCACGPVGTPFTISAPANSWTQDYLDVTNPKFGECMLQWMIEVPPTATLWAKNLEFCIDFTCGKKKQCVDANHWTEPYLDISAHEACGMSWALIAK